MPTDDVLINVRVNSDQAIREINKLLRAVQTAEQKAKTSTRTPDALRAQIAAAGDVAGLSKGRIKGESDAAWNARRAAIDGARSAVSKLNAELRVLQRQFDAVGRSGAVFTKAAAGIAPSGGDIRNLLLSARSLAGQGLLGQAVPGGAAGLQAQLAPILQQTFRGIQQQLLQTSRDLLLQRGNLQRSLTTQQGLGIGGGFGSPQTIQKLIDVNRAIQELSRSIPSLRFAGAAAQIKQLTSQFQNAGFAAKRFEATISPVVQRLITEKQRLEASAQARTVAGQIPAQGNVASQIVNVQRQLAAGAPNVRGLNKEMERLVGLQRQYALQWDTATKTFGHHALRIAEGLIIYNAFTRVLQGIAEGFQLIADVDREGTRLGLVLRDLTEAQTGEFLKGIGNIAVDTATDFRSLISVTDLVAATFKSLEGGGRVDSQGLLADVTGFEEIIGQFTNVIGPGNNIEAVTQQLIGLFRVVNAGLADAAGFAELEPLERFRRFMDSVVTIGGRSAANIEAISAGLAEAGLNANVAGFDLRLLAGIINDLFTKTPLSGAEIGTLFRTTLSKLSDPSVLKPFTDIVGGAVEVRNAVGDLRDADAILIDLFKAVESGAVSSEQARNALQTLVPPMNPGAIGFTNGLIESVGVALQAMARDAAEGAGALESSSIILANTLPGRFQSFTSRIQTIMLGFQGTIEGTALTFLRFGNSVLDVLETLGPEFTSTIASMLAFTGAGLVLMALFERFGFALLGIKGGIVGFQAVLASSVVYQRAFQLQATLSAAATDRFTIATAAASVGNVRLAASSTAAGVGFRVMAVSAGIAQAAIAGLVAIASRVAPLFLLFAAISAATEGLEQGGLISTLKEAIGLTEQQAQGLVHLQAILDSQAAQRAHEGDFLTLGALRPDQRGAELPQIPGLDISSNLTADQANNITNMVKAARDLAEAGEFTEGAWEAMIDAVNEANSAEETAILSTQDLFEVAVLATHANEEQALSIEELIEQITGQTNATLQLTAAEQLAADTETIRNGLMDEEAKAYDLLLDRLRAGKISMDEYAQGTSEINQVSELTAQLVAAVGDELAQLPQFAFAAAQGNDALAAAIFHVFQGATNLLPIIGPQVSQILRLAGAAATAGTAMQYWAISQVKLGSTFKAITEGSTATRNFALSQAQQAGAAIAAQANGIANALNNLFGSIAQGGSTSFGIGPGAAAAVKGPDLSILDMGDLTAAQLQQAVQLAIALQNQVPGAGAEAADDIITVIRDAVFQQQLRGIDQKYLQIAIDELTEQMEEANRLAAEQLQKETMLRNLTVSAGPLSALISQPTMFGLGGSLASGQGLNFDPTKGNFVVNVPIELRGLDPVALQQMIYEIIAKAIRDAARL